jgi:hypothetical protein
MRASRQLRTQCKSECCHCLALDAIGTMPSSDDDIEFISSTFRSEHFALAEYTSGAGAGSSGTQGHNQAILHAISSVHATPHSICLNTHFTCVAHVVAHMLGHSDAIIACTYVWLSIANNCFTLASCLHAHPGNSINVESSSVALGPNRPVLFGGEFKNTNIRLPAM